MKVVTISSWLNFGHPTPPGRGSAAGRKFSAPPYYSQCAVFASPLSTFFHYLFFLVFNSIIRYFIFVNAFWFSGDVLQLNVQRLSEQNFFGLIPSHQHQSTSPLFRQPSIDDEFVTRCVRIGWYLRTISGEVTVVPVTFSDRGWLLHEWFRHGRRDVPTA